MKTLFEIANPATLSGQPLMAPNQAAFADNFANLSGASIGVGGPTVDNTLGNTL